MINTALIFPGQGAQFVGMGRDFYKTSPEAKAVFDQADQLIPNLTKVVLDGPEEELIKTAYCQPGIFTFSMAALAALKVHPVWARMQPAFAAGLSLGEYSALAAADVLSFEETLKLVERRSFYMEEATAQAKGAMAAVIGFDAAELTRICEETGAEVANFNTPEQIVITGHADKVAHASEKIKAAGAKRVIPLTVSGAFHSSLMQPAAERFTKELTEAALKEAAIPVVHNVNGEPATAPQDIRRHLNDQITSSVQWVKTVEYVISQGVMTFLEIGPGTVLKGLIRKINRDAVVHTIQNPQDIDQIAVE